MKHKVTVLTLVLLTGCCSLKYPLDGKAVSWCERANRAENLCAAHGGIKRTNCASGGQDCGAHYGETICANGISVCVDNCEVLR